MPGFLPALLPALLSAFLPLRLRLGLRAEKLPKGLTGRQPALLRIALASSAVLSFSASVLRLRGLRCLGGGEQPEKSKRRRRAGSAVWCGSSERVGIQGVGGGGETRGTLTGRQAGRQAVR